MAKLALAGWMVLSGVVAVFEGYTASLPFVGLFAAGYAFALLGDLRPLTPAREDRAHEASDRIAADYEAIVTS